LAHTNRKIGEDELREITGFKDPFLSLLGLKSQVTIASDIII